MQALRWCVLVAVWWTPNAHITSSSSSSSSSPEHKIHNIVLYPDKHSWCKTTEIKQIVTYPRCNSVEIDNNVCVGACFSYSIPQTFPSAPGEVITPYCDSCQPAHYTWKQVKLTCEGESDEEDDGVVEMTKKVQVISNCTCTACSKITSHHTHPQKHSERTEADVPELMSLMMQQHNRQNQDIEEDKQEPVTEHRDIENLIDVDEKKAKENEEQDKIEILHVNHNHNQEVHLVEGPHHSLVIKPDNLPQHHQHATPLRHHKPDEESESLPSLLQNQFRVHDHEEYPDQIAVESSRKELTEDASQVLTVPELIYNEQPKTEEEEPKPVHHVKHHHEEPKNEERIAHHHSGTENHHHHQLQDHKGVKIVEVSHHHLTPAVEGAELTYVVKSKE